MGTSLTDLNAHLFAQMERLSDETLSDEDVEKEVKRAKAVVDVSDQITNIASLSISAAKLVAQHGDQLRNDLPMLEKKTVTGTPPAGKS